MFQDELLLHRAVLVHDVNRIAVVVGESLSSWGWKQVMFEDGLTRLIRRLEYTVMTDTVALDSGSTGTDSEDSLTRQQNKRKRDSMSSHDQISSRANDDEDEEEEEGVMAYKVKKTRNRNRNRNWTLVDNNLSLEECRLYFNDTYRYKYSVHGGAFARVSVCTAHDECEHVLRMKTMKNCNLYEVHQAGEHTERISETKPSHQLVDELVSNGDTSLAT
jgi:hypothetical protein